jgi:hypothetical protein
LRETDVLCVNGVEFHPAGCPHPTQPGPFSGGCFSKHGIYYFLVGAFVLVKRLRAPHVVHFYFVCLISFVLFAYSYTGKLNPFDWTIFWLDTAASVFLPPLFLHFCLEFPFRKSLLRKSRRLLVFLYAPGAVLLVEWALFVGDLVPSTLALRKPGSSATFIWATLS